MSLSRRYQARRLKASAARITHDTASTAKSKRIAIIGSGVSGLSCAHYLAAQHDITIFEANDYIGGHVNTIDVSMRYGNCATSKRGSKRATRAQVETSAIDTGFIVFNERTYPNFMRLLHELQVPFQATDMSFSVKNTARHFEYNGHTLNTLVSQRRNIVRPAFWRFITDIMRFNRHIRQLRQNFEARRAQAQDVAAFTEQTLGRYLASQRYGKLFTNNYLLPMVSAIWSTSIDDVRAIPLVFFAQFFDNHGLLDIVNRPQWFTIKGGSKQYVNTLVPKLIKAGGQVFVNTPVQSVIRDGNQVIVTVQDNNTVDKRCNDYVFDEVIFACHADTALSLLGDASADEQEVLGHFRFTDNTAVLHTDSSVLPNKPLAWASWNYVIDSDEAGSWGKHTLAKDKASARTSTITPATDKPVLTYHMNILQRLRKQHNYLVTLNHDVQPDHVIKRMAYRHPIYDQPIITAQRSWSRISGTHLHTHYCGAYWLNGFHEDGVRSALRVCQALGTNIEILGQLDPAHLPNAEQTRTPFRYKDLPIPSQRNSAKRKLKHATKHRAVQATTNQTLVRLIADLQNTARTRMQQESTPRKGLVRRLLGRRKNARS